MARLLPVFLVCWSFLLPVVLGAAIPFRWCATGPKEMAKCNAFKAALPAIATSAGVDITPGCVLGSNDEDCMKKIKDGVADLITLDGGLMITAGDKYGLQPVVAEDYGGEDGTKYYSVAVAKRSNTDVKFGNLKGKKSCHTGYRRTAGWRIPVGYLLFNKNMERKGCGTSTSDAASVAYFFSSSCAPGAPSAYSDKLCALCKAPVNDKCSKDPSINKYVGYHGSFYCMANGTGDVAFVKHLTAAEVVAEGYYGSLSDYVYLCTDGGRKEVTNTSHVNCNIGRNPSHAVMTKDGNNKEVFKKVLLEASTLCQGNTAQNCSNFTIFDSAKYTGRDLLFKDSTEKLVGLGDRNTYKKWLGSYYNSQEAVLKSSCPTGAPTVVTTTAVVATTAVHATPMNGPFLVLLALIMTQVYQP